MVRLKRCLCLVLALALLLTWPGFLPQKAEAVAIADDTAVLSLALLFTTWAGVTFNQSDQAVTAMKNFLSTKVSTATSLAGLITKNLVVDGAKLLITGDVRTAFKTALPEIRGFFKADSDIVASTGSGTLSDLVVCGPLYSAPVIPYSSSMSYDDFLVAVSSLSSSAIFPSSPGHDYEFYVTLRNKNTIIFKSKYESAFHVYYGGSIRFSLGDSNFHPTFIPFVEEGVSRTSFRILYFVDGQPKFASSWNNFSDVVSVSFRPVSPSPPISYNLSQSLNGSSVSSSLDSADLDTANASISIAPVTSVVSSGVAGSTAAPGLSAEEYEKILADVLASTAVIPTTPQPTTAEPEPTTATPEEDKTHVITPDILGGMFEGLKGWLQSLLNSILEAIQAIPEKIDSLWESMKAWWIQTIADVKAWIEVKIQSISDWWTTFWAETKALILSISNALTEFFTVTFPAWITDVKEWALALPKTLVDAIVLALTAVFVPAVGYWDAKVAALQAKFPLFNSILTTGKGFSGFFSGLGTRPPIIYIDLGSSVSWAMGGRTIFLDLTWYSQYKPTMDLVIAGFLWLLFAWRFFLRLPGLLRGEVGTIDRLDSYLSEKRKKNGG